MTKSDRGERSSRGEYQSSGDPASEAGDAACPSTLRKEPNLFDAVAIVVGTIIGSGIFLIPSSLAAQLNCLGAVLLLWLVGGVLTLFGALSAELGSIFPGTGGLCTATWMGLFVLFAVIGCCVPFMVQHGSDIGAGLNVPVDTLLFSGASLCLARSQP
jgi:hypothetical protein